MAQNKKAVYNRHVQSDIVSYYQCYKATWTLTKQARESARAGFKDEARMIANFLRQSYIVQILKTVDFTLIGNVDVTLLEWEIGQLNTECHPLDQADLRNDLKAIRATNETIAFGISELLRRLQK